MEDGTLAAGAPRLALDSSLLYRALRGTALATEARQPLNWIRGRV